MVEGWVCALFEIQLCLDHGSGTGLMAMGLTERDMEGQDTTLSPTLPRLTRESERMT